MSIQDTITRLKAHGVQPSAQRVAIAAYVLSRKAGHFTADAVWRRVREKLPTLSRATVYNTLNLFADRGMVRRIALDEGPVVFDVNVEPHHHFVDVDTGDVLDIPAAMLRVEGLERLAQSMGIDIETVGIVVRGRRDSGRPVPSPARPGASERTADSVDHSTSQPSTPRRAP